MTDIALDTLVVRIAADTRPLDDALSRLQSDSEGAFDDMADSASAASRVMDRALSGFLASGRSGFRNLKETAIAVLAEIASEIVRTGLGKILGLPNPGQDGGRSTGGLILGRRAMGGPVSAGMPYLVGERGPELFLPALSGRIVPNHALGATSLSAPARHTSITVNVHGTTGDAAGVRMSAAQVAAAVGRALARAERTL